MKCRILFTIIATVMNFYIFICVVDLKTRYYTLGILTVRTPT